MISLPSRVRCIVAGLAIPAILAGLGHPIAHAQDRAVARGTTIAPSRPMGTLGTLITIPENWNNCGPASVAEVLGFWGIQRTQAQVQAVLRADKNPGGMGPYGVPAYARSLGLRALLGVEGTPALIKAFISNGLPVIVNQWVSVSYHVRHYRPIQSYDDRAGVFVASDPYMGANYAISYREFMQIWSVSNRRFLLLYPPDRQPLVRAVLRSVGWNGSRAYRDDLLQQQARLRTNQSGQHRRYGYLNLAWDELQLGRDAAARRALGQAARAGANPIDVGWITHELPAHS